MPDQLRARLMAHALLVTLATLLGAGAGGCDDTASASAPVATVLGGMKDLEVGVQGEYYLGRGRFSVFVGAGYVLPDPDEEELPKGAVLSAGGRAFTSGFRHRGLVEISYGALARGLEAQDDETVDPVMIYGPSLLLGYQHVAKSGLTLLAAGGVGYARWAAVDRSFWSFELRLGAGYTWR